MHALDGQNSQSQALLGSTHASAAESEGLVETLERSPLNLLCSYIFATQFPKIKECECFQFDRKRFSNFRSQFEDAIVEQANQFYPAEKQEKVFRILDIGAGGCFQTLVILDKFLKAGQKNIELTLADNCYAHSNCQGSNESVEQFQKFVEEQLLRKYVDAHVEIKVETGVQEAFEKYTEAAVEPPHVILMIDLQSEPFYSNDGKKTTFPTLLEFSMDFILKNRVFSDNTLLVSTDVGRIPRGGIGDEFCYGRCAPKSWIKIMKQVRSNLMDYCTAKSGREHGIIYYNEGYRYKIVEQKI